MPLCSLLSPDTMHSWQSRCPGATVQTSALPQAGRAAPATCVVA